MKKILILVAFVMAMTSCKKDEEPAPYVPPALVEVDSTDPSLLEFIQRADIRFKAYFKRYAEMTIADTGVVMKEALDGLEVDWSNAVTKMVFKHQAAAAEIQSYRPNVDSLERDFPNLHASFPADFQQYAEAWKSDFNPENRDSLKQELTSSTFEDVEKDFRKNVADAIATLSLGRLPDPSIGIPVVRKEE